MKKPVFMFFAAIVLSAACSKIELAGVSATKCQNISGNYSSIVVDGNIVVEVSSSCEMAEITSDANILPYVDVYTDNGTLYIEYGNGARFSSGRFETVVRIPENTDVQGIRLLNSAYYRNDGIMKSAYYMKLEADSGSGFDMAGLIAKDVILNLQNSSLFSAGYVSLTDATFNISGGSKAEMDGIIGYCDAFMSGFSTLAYKTDTYVDNYALTIDQFNAQMSDASSAYFHSDGYLSGTLTGGSSIVFTGMAQNYASMLDSSWIENM